MSPGSATSSRRRAREVALQVLYAIDLGGRPGRHDDASAEDDHATDGPEGRAAATSPCAVFDAVAEHFEMPAGARAFAKELAVQVTEHREALDERIAGVARNWRIVRMAAVDRNILRLGTYELVYSETPSAVILNEAVDLARRYGSDPSPAFVNGILDAVAKEAREDPT